MAGKMHHCLTEGSNGPTKLHPNGRPYCDIVRDQFGKWVTWATRYATLLDQRIPVKDGRKRRKLSYHRKGRSYVGTVQPEGMEGWTPDNSMLLDVDQMNGNGPETITFKNVPPGTYQIVVNKYSNDFRSNIAAGNPRVTIYMGGNGVAFECTIDPQCKRSAQVWNVVNIKVYHTDEFLENGERKYRIDIVDEEKHMKRLHWVDLPTTDDVHLVFGLGGKWFRLASAEYSDKYLANVCAGQCRPTRRSAGFESCLHRWRHPHTEETTVEV
eukprot:TRINITY_DN4783_c0_g2_i2.p1 TRINITY_DN4783_c0_g2~~TRINITY_DN4783_c0_g2_i2.p1  ORF type:complete len:278 (-),score=14.63 TRINITY_DN4783_c0_g2_i2:246-1052(-)